MAGHVLNRLGNVKNRLTRKPERARRRSHLGVEVLEHRDNPSQSFGAGDIIATLVGTGSTLTSSGTATSIVEYNPSTSTLVQTISLASTGTGAFTESGTATGEGYLTDAADGHSVELGGYNVAAGTSDASAVGTIAVIQPAGTVDLTTHIPNASTAFNGSNSIKAVASADGLGFYVATDNYIQYVPYGNSATTATTTVEKYFTANDGTSGGFETSQSPNDVAIGDGQLYGDAGSEAQTDGVPAADGPFTVGSGLPTTGGQSASVFQGPSTTSSGTPSQFVTSEQFSVSPDGQVFVIADARTNGAGGLYVWQISTGNTLAMTGSYTYTNTGLTGLSVNWSTPSAPTIYAVTTNGNTGNNANSIVAFNSVSINESLGTASLGSPTTVATAAANEAFRGVAPVPVAAASTPATTTTLSVTNNSGSYGSVGLSATVTGGSGSYTGSVSFMNNGVEIGSAPISGGVATLSPSTNLLAGSYSAGALTAEYTGDANNAASTSTNNPTATVAKYSTSETVGDSGGGNAITGTPDTLTDTLTVPTGTLPTGTVQFYDGGTSAGDAIGSPVSVVQEITPTGPGGSAAISFVASLPWTFTTAGTHDIYAAYGGDSNFASVTNLSAYAITVVNATTTTITSTNSNPGGSGVAITFTVTVTGNTTTGAPTGTVQWAINAADIGSPAALTPQSGTDYSTATLTETTSLTETAPGTLTPGVDSVTAVYNPTPGNTYGTSTGILNQTVQAIALAAGDVLVYQTGDGAGTYFNSNDSGLANTVYIDEYNPTTNALVEQIVMPTSTGGGYNAFTQQGYYGFGAFINSTPNGDFVFAGDDVSPGGNGETAPQDIAVLYPNGTINDSTIDTGDYSLRSVASVDGKEFWEGTSGGVYYTTLGADGASTQVNATTPAVTGRNIKISNGQLYISSDTANFVGVSTVGTGLPTTTGQTVTLLNHMQASDYSTSGFGPYDYFFATLKTGDTSPDTLYVTDDEGGILKYTLSGGVWSLTATAALDANGTTPNEYCALTGVVNNGVVTLYATDNIQFGATTGGSVVAITDNSGYGGTGFSSASPTYIGNAGTNTNWHGDAVVPVETTTTLTQTGGTESTGASVGESITFTVSVTSTNAGGASPTGTVQFYDGLVPIGSPIAVSSSNSDTATMTVTSALTQTAGELTPGINTITAAFTGDYDGDLNGGEGYANSSAVENQVVKPQAFGTGDQLVYRVGDGTNAPNTTHGTAVFVDEYTNASPAVLVQSIAMPTADAAGSDGNYYHALVQIGGASNPGQYAGQLSQSGTGQNAFLVGYDETPTPYTIPPSDNTDRTIARISYNGTIGTMTVNNASITTGSFLSYVTGVYSDNDSEVWISGTEASGLLYVPTFTPNTSSTYAATQLVSGISGTNFINETGLEVYSGNLYMGVTTNGGTYGGSSPFEGILNLGSASSLTTAGAITPASYDADADFYGTALGNKYAQDVFFASPTSAYVTYASSSSPYASGGIAKLYYNGTSWALEGTIAASPTGSPVTGGTPGFYGLSGTVSTSEAVTLHMTWAYDGATTSGDVTGELYELQDTNAPSATFSSTTVTAVNTQTDGGGLEFHGVGRVPLPAIALPAKPVVNGNDTDTGATTVTSASESTNTVTIVTQAANGFFNGEFVTIGGVSTAGYNGTYQITVVSGNTFTYTDNNITNQTTDTGGGTAVNALAGSQRSMVDSVTYTFNQPVLLAQAGTANGDAISITGTGPNAGTPPGWTYYTPDNGTTWIVTFTGVTGNSIGNGEYQIVLNASAVSAVGSRASLASSDTETFYRLFGDVTGAQIVNNADNARFKQTYLLSTGQNGFNAAFDYSAAGIVNNADNVRFKNDYLTSYTGFTPTI